jgi:preprotein translocase subunit YajC
MQDFFASPIFPFLLIIPIIYFMIIRPQQQRAKQHREMVENVRRGDTVITAGGIVGRVAKPPQKDDTEITIEVADNVQIRVVRSTLTEVRSKDAKTDKS